MEMKQADIVLCEFYFSDLKRSKNRPVLILKDNLPFDDFVGIPISSQINSLQNDEVLFVASDFKEGALPAVSKLMIRKTFVVSRKVVLKKYGSLKKEAFIKYHKLFCEYFGC